MIQQGSSLQKAKRVFVKSIDLKILFAGMNLEQEVVWQKV